MKIINYIVKLIKINIILLALLATALYAQNAEPANEEGAAVAEEGVKDEEVKADETLEPVLEYTPFSEMRPMERDRFITNRHSVDFGLSTSTSTYFDSSQDFSLLLGFYRPYVKYRLYDTANLLLRPKVSVTQFIGSKTKKSSLSASIEQFSIGVMPHPDHTFVLGRQYAYIGKGLLFANYADGLKYQGNYSFLKGNAYVLYSGQYAEDLCALNLQGCGKNVVNPYNVVPGLPVDQQVFIQPDTLGRRIIAMLEVSLPPLYGNTFSVGMLYAKDMIQYKLPNLTFATFNPVYLAFGLKGYIYTPDLRYNMELDVESGESYNIENQAQGVILAAAYQADFSYALPIYENIVKPNLLMQFAFATGDSDKTNLVYPTQTNTKKTDNAFYYFGAYSGGLGLKPMLSNMFIYRAGFSMRPAYSKYDFRNVYLVFKYSYYRKIVGEGVISDLRAYSHVNPGTLTSDEIVSKKYVGSGVDLTLLWKFKTELSFYYSLGLFIPGSAFPDSQKLDVVNLLSAAISF